MNILFAFFMISGLISYPLCGSQISSTISLKPAITSNSNRSSLWPFLLTLGLLTSPTQAAVSENGCPTKITHSTLALPSYYQDHRHPGKISVENIGLSDMNRIMGLLVRFSTSLNERNLLSVDADSDESFKMLELYKPSLFGSCKIDYPITGEDPVDRFHHAKAIELVNKQLLPKGIQTLNEDALVTLMCLVNTALQNGGKDFNPIRHQRGEMRILISSLPHHKTQEVREELSSDPAALEAYNYLVQELTDQKKELLLIDNWKTHFMQVLENPSHPSYWWVKTQYDFIKDEGNPAEIRRKLKSIFRKTKQKLADPFEAAAYLHMEVVKLHPFLDGNGGTARLFVAALLFSSGYMPPVMWSNKEYMDIVQEAKHSNDATQFAVYLRKMVCQAEETFIKKENMDSYTKLVVDMINTFRICLVDPVKCEAGFQEKCDEYFIKLGLKQEKSNFLVREEL